MTEIGSRESGMGKSRACTRWRFTVSVVLPALPTPDFRLPIPGSATRSDT
jgi:hypothetical protein